MGPLRGRLDDFLLNPEAFQSREWGDECLKIGCLLLEKKNEGERDRKRKI